MLGTTRRLSLRRRLIADLMHASSKVPFVTIRATLSIGPLLDARASVQQPPGWAAIFVKAFSLAARDEPVLRTLYLKWPWPRLYELQTSIGVVAIARHDDGEHSVLFQKVTDTAILHMSETNRRIRYAKSAPVQDVDFFKKLLNITALPLPLRRLMWTYAMNSGRQRSNHAGTFGVTSVSAFGNSEVHALSPGPYLLSYGAVKPDQTIDVLIRWDHRLTDGALMALTMARLETILNTEIVEELQELYPASHAGLRIAAT